MTHLDRPHSMLASAELVKRGSCSRSSAHSARFSRWLVYSRSMPNAHTRLQHCQGDRWPAGNKAWKFW